jgi:hypothetical protein
MLEGDPEFADSLPLGNLGGVIGLTRDKSTGMPMGGIQVQSQEPDTTLSVVRYLNEGKTAFDATETASHGLFVIIEPKLGEKFDAVMGGEPIEGADGTVGSAKDVIFTLVLDI